MKVEHNIARLKHLISLYELTVDSFLKKISEGLRNLISEEDIFSNAIKVSHLKRIDKVFDKGIHYYLDPKAPETSKEASIFFRKQNFNSDLNIGARKIVNHFEEFKISLSAIAKLAELDIKRVVREYNVSEEPKQAAREVREFLYPIFNRNLKEFLRALISKLAEKNILVFEFVETWNKKETANIDGFFLTPNVIVLKRHQIAFRREIFTLAHELGHYLLNEEEIERLEYSVIAERNSSTTERWCNDFAYYFLIGEYADVLGNLESASADNDYHFEILEKISRETHLSQIALFTRLLYQQQISISNYNTVKADFNERNRLKREEEAKKKQLLKDQNIKQKGSVAIPIPSPLLISTIQTAFNEGVINEYELCQKLNIKPEKLDKYIK